ncbi:TPA: hypothetical protein ACF7E6_001957 [Klebsiella aerogenes]|uniref:hypothetical protein n=1 Tax=Klebsiella aerogenes TaxID=548 RepID=UPI00321DB403
MKDKLLLIRNQLKMGHRLSFAEAMLLHKAIDIIVNKAENSPVIPDGYVMVPKEPTEDMIVAGFESAPDEDFSEPEVWEEYQNLSGCQQAAHRARLCWAAMLTAIPPVPKN